jgi:hypothetical protein
MSVLELESEVWQNILDDKGNPRLSVARSLFLPLKQDSIPLLKEAYSYWEKYVEYMVLSATNVETEEKLYLAVKCSKRGNDVFSRRLNRKFGFFNHVEDVKLFSIEDFEKRAVTTNLLWVTLTYDSKRCSLHEAWINCMEEYNKFITNLRNKYGKIEVLRFPQPFDDEEGLAYGYPHKHLVLLFKEAQFDVFPRWEVDKEGREVVRYRIQQKDEVVAQGKWHSHVDIKALNSPRAAVSYCRKYAQSVLSGETEKGVLTCGILWLYKKQTYSMSSGFKDAYLDLIRYLQDSKKSMVQLTLEGDKKPIWVWVLHGIRSGVDVGGSGEWFIELEADKFHRLVGGG